MMQPKLEISIKHPICDSENTGVVRYNMLTRQGYRPYCNNNRCMNRCYWAPKDQTHKCHCGWKAEKASPEFLKLYSQIWSNDPLHGTIKMSYLPQAQQARIKTKLNDSLTLCLDRHAFNRQAVKRDAVGVFNFNMGRVHRADARFLSRNLVDQLGLDPQKDAPLYNAASAIAIDYPQVLGYILVRCGNEVLTYARKLTDEQRLLGKCSLGFGGHIDPSDCEMTIESEDSEHINLWATVFASVKRELCEELGINPEDFDKVGRIKNRNQVVMDTRVSTEGNGTIAVGQVHAGILFEYTVEDKALINPNDECQDPQWKLLGDLIGERDMYESWSQLIITHLSNDIAESDDEHEDEGAPDDDVLEDDEPVSVLNADVAYTDTQWEEDKPF